MFIVFGFYKFKAKKQAYRSEFCNSCQQPRLTQRIRAFVVGHLFWIPLLPFGFWGFWTCTTCGNDPAVNTRTTGQGVIQLLALTSGFFAGVMTLVWYFTKDENGVSEFGSIAVALWAIASLTTAINIYLVRKRNIMHPVEPTDTNICSICGAALGMSPGRNKPRLTCPICQIERIG